MAEDQNRSMQDKFMLRLPDGMRDRIRASAEENGRSMNAEIIARLEQSFEPPNLSIDAIGRETVKQIAASDKHLPQRVRDRFFTIYEDLRQKEMDTLRRMSSAASDVRAELDIIAKSSEADM